MYSASYYIYVHSVGSRLYHWFSYIFLIQNAFVGIFAALMRILYSALIGLVLLTRLDRPLLMKGFESYDRGREKILCCDNY